jgi:hypothetical protein
LEFAGFQEVVFGEGVEAGEGLSFEFSEGGVHLSFGQAKPVSGTSVVAVVFVGHFKLNLIALGNGNLFQRVSQVTIVEKKSKP